MKKQIKYLLLVGVALIWGIVLYKVIRGLNNEDSIVRPSKGVNNNVAKASAKKSYDLLPHYSDPFGAEEFEDMSISNADTLIKISPIPAIAITEKIPENISFVKYKGSVMNSTTKKMVGILSINGKDEYVKPKVRLNEITILQIKKDKIFIKYHKNNFWIKKE